MELTAAQERILDMVLDAMGKGDDYRSTALDTIMVDGAARILGPVDMAPRCMNCQQRDISTNVTPKRKRLCWKCYARFLELIALHQTSWEELSDEGKCADPVFRTYTRRGVT